MKKDYGLGEGVSIGTKAGRVKVNSGHLNDPVLAWGRKTEAQPWSGSLGGEGIVGQLRSDEYYPVGAGERGSIDLDPDVWPYGRSSQNL